MTGIEETDRAVDLLSPSLKGRKEFSVWVGIKEQKTRFVFSVDQLRRSRGEGRRDGLEEQSKQTRWRGQWQA